MNTLLTKHVEQEEGKTKAESIEAYNKAWQNSGYLFRPLLKMLQERVEVLDKIEEKDFEVPNHYAKLMFYKGKKTEAEFFLSLLPKSIKD
jgi:hypothetical protein